MSPSCARSLPAEQGECETSGRNPPRGEGQARRHDAHSQRRPTRGVRSPTFRRRGQQEHTAPRNRRAPSRLKPGLQTPPCRSASRDGLRGRPAATMESERGLAHSDRHRHCDCTRSAAAHPPLAMTAGTRSRPAPRLRPARHRHLCNSPSRRAKTSSTAHGTRWPTLVWKWKAFADKHSLLTFLPLCFAGLTWLSCLRCIKRGEDFAKSIYEGCRSATGWGVTQTTYPARRPGRSTPESCRGLDWGEI